MPLYMDRHELVNVTPEELAQAHVCDLEVQDKYGVRYVTYWYHRRSETSFCLVDAPDRDAAEAVHRESHGALACEIIEVDWDAVEGFLGPVREPEPGETWEDSPFRAIVCTSLGDPFIPGANAERVISRLLRARGGLEVQQDDGAMGCFPSVLAALEYGLAMQASFGPLASLYSQTPVRARIGIDLGAPVTRALRAGLFDEVSRIATGLCSLARPGETLVSSEVRDLCAGGGFQFEDRGEVRLAGIGPSVRCYRLEGKSRSEAMPSHVDVPDGLSPRELEVLRLIAAGRTNREIAAELVVSLSTVTTHVRNIFEKTEVANRAEAASYAYRHRLILLPGG